MRKVKFPVRYFFFDVERWLTSDDHMWHKYYNAKAHEDELKELRK